VCAQKKAVRACSRQRKHTHTHTPRALAHSRTCYFAIILSLLRVPLSRARTHGPERETADWCVEEMCISVRETEKCVEEREGQRIGVWCESVLV